MPRTRKPRDLAKVLKDTAKWQVSHTSPFKNLVVICILMPPWLVQLRLQTVLHSYFCFASPCQKNVSLIPWDMYAWWIFSLDDHPYTPKQHGRPSDWGEWADWFQQQQDSRHQTSDFTMALWSLYQKVLATTANFCQPAITSHFLSSLWQVLHWSSTLQSIRQVVK